jgi:hypothetical protein
MEDSNLTKSKERIQKHGEVFTPQWVVNDMLDLLPADVWEAEKTFLEPACGEGAFLIEIYRRKLQNIKVTAQSEWQWQAAIATSAIYGIELLEDNAQQCVENLIRVFSDFYHAKYPDTRDEAFCKTVLFLIKCNIIRGNALTYRRCSVQCGNGCTKCEKIIFSEWTPLANQQFKRKDYAYEEIVKFGVKRQTPSSGRLFLEEECNCIKEYEPVNYKELQYVSN